MRHAVVGVVRVLRRLRQGQQKQVRTATTVREGYYPTAKLTRDSRRFTMCAESKGGNLTNCKDLGLTAQAFEHIEECNTWDKKTCKK